MEEKKVSQYSFKELRTICQTTAPNPARESLIGLSSRIFSIYLTKLLLILNIGPHQTTIISVLVFFLGLGFFIFNDYGMNIIGLAIIYLSIILDCCDGEVARFRKKTTAVGGMYTEPVSHDIQYGIAFLLFGIILFSNGYSFIYLILGAVASISKLLYRLLEIRYWYLVHIDKTQEEIDAIKKAYSKKHILIRLFYWTNKNFFSSTAIFTILLIFSLINRVELYLWWFAIGYLILWILLFAKQLYIINRKRLYEKAN